MFEHIKISDIVNKRNLNAEVLSAIKLLKDFNITLDIDNGPWIGGGIITKLFDGSPIGDSDIDIFLGDINHIRYQEKTLHNELLKANFVQTESSKHALTWQGHDLKIQTIRRNKYPSPYSVLGSFDFTVVKAVSDGENIIMHSDMINDIKNKSLKIDHISPPSKNISFRSMKYIRRGYMPDLRTSIFIINKSKDEIEELY